MRRQVIGITALQQTLPFVDESEIRIYKPMTTKHWYYPGFPYFSTHEPCTRCGREITSDLRQIGGLIKVTPSRKR